MGTNLLLEMEHRGVEAKLHAFSGDKIISVADASELIAHGIEATEALRSTWEYPRRALGETGLESADFNEICRKVLSILDTHLTLLGLIRRTAMLASDREGRMVPKLADLDRADAVTREARRKVEDLLALTRRPPGEGIDWNRVREAEDRIAQGQFARLNPDAQVDKAGVG